MRSEMSRLIGSLAALALGALVAACTQPSEKPASPPEDATISRQIVEKATIVSVDKANRWITLRDKNGLTFTVEAGPEVRNFDQIQAGDTVSVHYAESLAVALAKPGEPLNPPSVAVGAARAAPGEKPAAGIGAQVNATVRIESVDLTKNIVTFTPQGTSSAGGGMMRAVHVETPEGRKFIQGLKPGDQVQITYTEAVAVSIDRE
jgi:hypothetical protein